MSLKAGYADANGASAPPDTEAAVRLISCEYNGIIHWGVVNGDQVTLCPAVPELPANMLALIDLGRERLGETVAAMQGHAAAVRAELAAVRLLAPIPRPRKNIICMGLNYAAHALESLQAKGLAAKAPQYPVVFTKNVTTVAGPYEDIPLDPAVTAQFDWEVELALVIGRSGRNIAKQRALEHVFGYTVVNDLSARDIQFRHQQFFLGKSLDKACPMGPWIVSADEIPDPQTLALSCHVNGSLKQSGNTCAQLLGVADIVSLLSRNMTLEAGDIIATGTPEGVGFARTPPEFLQAGDLVECRIDGIGTIRNRIVAAAPG